MFRKLHCLYNAWELSMLLCHSSIAKLRASSFGVNFCLPDFAERSGKLVREVREITALPDPGPGPFSRPLQLDQFIPNQLLQTTNLFKQSTTATKSTKTTSKPLKTQEDNQLFSPVKEPFIFSLLSARLFSRSRLLSTY